MAAAAAVGIAVVLACCVAYLVVRDQLRGQVDSALRAQATVIERGDSARWPGRFRASRRAPAAPRRTSRRSLADGTVLPRQGGVALPVNRQAIAARGRRRRAGT